MTPPPQRRPPTGGGGNYRPPGRRDTGNQRRGRVDLRRRPGPPTEGGQQARQPRRPLPPEILRRLEVDPLFQVMTSDQQQWIDPYTGTPVPASLGRLAAAREYLTESGVWRDREPLPRHAIEMTRWRLELMRLLPIDPRLRIFGRDGRGWLNPYNGELVDDITREDGKITVRTVTAMARHLSTCQQAQLGRMLDNQQLMGRVQALGLSNNAGSSAANAGAKSSSHLGSPSGTGAELSDDMARAKNVQDHMLADLPDIPGYELAVHFSPHSGVSGDFYEVLTLGDGRVMMVVGDVSGHGMQAALVVATALKTLRFLARQISDLPQLLTQFNNEIKSDLIPGQFITIFAALLDPHTSRLTCVRAGHHAGLIANLEAGTVLRKIGHQGIAIGLVSGSIFAQSLNPEVIALQPGDVMLQYTDGLTEAIDAESEEYGEARLYGSFLGHLSMSLQDMVDGVAQTVVDYAGGSLGDDLTIFSLAVFDEEAEPPAGGAAT